MDPPRSVPITSNARQFQNSNGRTTAPSPAGESRGVQQPKPQTLPQRTGPSSIIVNNRQKGNPILKEIKSQAWEWGDIAPDYVLGVGNCALFLSLKYHRLHPEYIYGRISQLRHTYNLCILLTMVDIENHEESLKELSKTSLINNVTIILCWSAAEAARYLELYKTYEHAGASAIKAPQSTNHGDKLIEFITIPRSVNKTDALGLVSNFGSVRTALNARPDEILMIAGWGPTKVKHWHAAISEPFRTRRAARRGITRENTLFTPSISHEPSREEEEVADEVMGGVGAISSRPQKRPAADISVDQPDDAEEAILEATRPSPAKPIVGDPSPTRKAPEPEVSDGVLAALAKLREQG